MEIAKDLTKENQTLLESVTEQTNVEQALTKETVVYVLLKDV